MQKVIKSAIARRVARSLDLGATEQHGQAAAQQLSAASRQRIALAARADQPAQGVAAGRTAGRAGSENCKETGRLKPCGQEVGITFIYVTHDQEEALIPCRTVIAVMDRRLECNWASRRHLRKGRSVASFHRRDELPALYGDVDCAAQRRSSWLAASVCPSRVDSGITRIASVAFAAPRKDQPVRTERHLQTALTRQSFTVTSSGWSIGTDTHHTIVSWTTAYRHRPAAEFPRGGGAVEIGEEVIVRGCRSRPGLPQ